MGRLFIASLWGFAGAVQAQTTEIPLSGFTLDQCVGYALQHQPVLKQSQLDQEINERGIRAELSAWLPQVNATYNLQHYLKLPVSFLPNQANPDGPRQAITLGLPNTSSLQLEADQLLYSNDLLLASRAARVSRLQTEQQTENTRINVVVGVSKAYYDILLSQEQVHVLEEDIVRLERLLQDSYHLYQSGVTDKIDYKQATVSLNNSRSQRRAAAESVKAKYASLKQLMGYPAEKRLEVASGRDKLEEEIQVDTLPGVQYENRIEYQLLQTQIQLQSLQVSYNQMGYLPSVSAFVNYNFTYQNRVFQDLYLQNFPNSAAGLKVSLPLFTGTRRFQNLQQSRLQLQRLALGADNLEAQITAQYQQALAGYQSNLTEWKTQAENQELAREVYNIVKLQYDEGVKTYLDVITAEAALRTAQLTYLNALYSLLASKLDVQQAMGKVPLEP